MMRIFRVDSLSVLTSRLLVSGVIGQEHIPARRTTGRTVRREEEGSGGTRRDGGPGRGWGGLTHGHLDHVEITYIMIVSMLHMCMTLIIMLTMGCGLGVSLVDDGLQTQLQCSQNHISGLWTRNSRVAVFIPHLYRAVKRVEG